MEEKVRAHLYVSGRVQGVFLRVNTIQEAQSLGVFGWVKNLEDGRVEAIIEGPLDKVQELVQWIKQDPASAKVEHIDVQWEAYKGEFTNFKKISRWQNQ